MSGRTPDTPTTTSSKDHLAESLPLSIDLVTELAGMFQLMADPSRLRIILECLHTPVSVSDIARRLCLSSSLVSHHLRLLRAARLIQSERHGTRIFYHITDEHIRRTLSDMTQHVREDDEPAE